MHYVAIAQDRVEVLTYDREQGFAERHLDAVADRVELKAIGVALPLADIYLDAGAAGRK
jgi:hypothetical protein